MRLCKITDLQTGSQLGTAAVGRNLPQDGFEEGGFSSAVRSDQCHTFFAFQNQVRTGEEWATFIGIANLQVIGAQNQISGATDGLQPQVHGAGVAFGGSQAAVLQQAFEPPLATARLVGVLAAQVFADIVFLFLDIFGLGFIFCQSAGITLLALVQIGAVISTVDLQRGCHFPDYAGGLVEEITIVRNDHDRTVPVTQIRFEPFYSVDIQMVAGFVQKENVRVFEQDARQAGTRALTS